MSEKNEKTVRKQKKEQIREKYKRYRDGAEGCISWVEENVCVPIYPEGSEFAVWTLMGSLPDKPNPETGRSYKGMWEKQKEVLREALVMENGRFKHRLIIFCWPRGEGKSFLAILIQMWKFCCWPKQDIVLCANSKEQVGMVHYDIMRDHILNSPGLLKIVGKKNVQEGKIRIKDKAGNALSKAKTISSFSGIVSNITGYAFSEIFELKNEDFWYKVDGSIRNVPNAFGVIDSTVSSKEHLLYRLYQAYVKNTDPLIYFSYRCSEKADYRDFWHPNQTQAQLNSYKAKAPLTFAKHFMNLWSAGAEKVFSREMVEGINYLGADKNANSHDRVIELIRKRHSIIDNEEKLESIDGVNPFKQYEEIEDIDRHLWPVTDVYELIPSDEEASIASSDALEELSKIYDTDWAILVGMDRADPMKRRTAARTIVTAIAKGLPGSRSNPGMGMLDPPENSSRPGKPEYGMSGPAYLYIVLHVASIVDHSIESVKKEIQLIFAEYDGIDTFGSERYGAFDLKPWLEEQGAHVDLWAATYDRQLSLFTEFYNAVVTGRFKSPPSNVAGMKGDDIISEEMAIFDHDPDSRWFGSPEKKHKTGIQDDWMYACGGAMYGGRFMTVDNFRIRKGRPYFGTMILPNDLLSRGY